MEVGQKYFPQIDSLRFIAVFMVLLSHWLPVYWIEFFQLGKLGVELFFVISGFLITRILFQLKENRPPQNKYLVFYARRFLRIFPIYYFVLFITFIFGSAIVRESFFWNAAFLTNFYTLYHGSWPGPISHFWSLAVEEQFYLIWPLLILMTPRSRLRWPIIGSIIVAIAFRTFFFVENYDYWYAYIFTFSCFDNLGAGALLAWIYHFKPASFSKVVNQNGLFGVCFLCFALCLTSYYWYQPYNLLNIVLLRAFTSAVFFFILGKAILSKQQWLLNPQIILLGKMSYSIYLFHNFIPGFYLGMTSPENIYLRFVIYFVTVVGISWLSWKFIEIPFNRFKSRFPYA